MSQPLPSPIKLECGCSTCLSCSTKRSKMIDKWFFKHSKELYKLCKEEDKERYAHAVRRICGHDLTK